MKMHWLITAGLLAVPAVWADTQTAVGTDAAAAFARLKGLVGEWEANTDVGKARLIYELTGGGSAVVERESAENMPPMMTVYHLDGNRLVLTHYCMAGNQPRMEARSFDPATREIRFRFLDATGLTSPGAGHMHNSTIRLMDADHIESEWQFFENGQPKMTEKFQYKRVR
jgi:hypothetical protein